jgi:hypothetical protein
MTHHFPVRESCKYAGFNATVAAQWAARVCAGYSTAKCVREAKSSARNASAFAMRVRNAMEPLEGP